LEFIAIGKCLGIAYSQKGFMYRLHFRGYFKGSKIQEIRLMGKKSTQEMWKNEEYIVHAKVHSIKTKELYGKILRVKDLKMIKVDFL
jgi:hypothetical protein